MLGECCLTTIKELGEIDGFADFISPSECIFPDDNRWYVDFRFGYHVV
jgi:hypothetical protein